MLVWSEVLKQYIYKCWDEPKVIPATVEEILPNPALSSRIAWCRGQGEFVC